MKQETCWGPTYKVSVTPPQGALGAIPEAGVIPEEARLLSYTKAMESVT